MSQERREKLTCLECQAELHWDPDVYRLVAPHLRLVVCTTCQFEHCVLDGSLVGKDSRKRYTDVDFDGITYSWKDEGVEEQVSTRHAPMVVKAILLSGGQRLWPDMYYEGYDK